MNRKRFGVVACLLLIAAVPAVAQPKPGAAELPISRVVLFSSGVGYYQRDGQVDGSARIDLQFATSNINDLLKRLVLQDQGGGQISTVSYDNRDPLDKTLKSFALDLTSNPSLGDLLNQARGERLEVTRYREHGIQGEQETLTGVIVGVEKHKQPVGKDQVVETQQLNLLTEDGLQGVALARVAKVRLLRPELEQEFRKALAALATGHDKQKKTVTLNFLGNGKRAVRVGYVMESPIWKTSYRLSLDDNKAFLQGWAVVENTTDEDWNRVQLGLISGRPISFQMDLYQPLYLPRPVVEPELFASLRPQTYSGNLEEQRRAEGRDQRGAMRGDSLGRSRFPGLGGLPGGGAGFGGGGQTLGRNGTPPPAAAPVPGAEREALGEEEGKAKDSPLNLGQGVASAALATELGEYFQYQIEHPVSLARQKSALIPIVNGPVEAAKVSIYNEAVQPKFPLLGLRFKNTTGLHLMQGPVTVFENNSYAGDARVSDLQPGETRLVSYAVDLGTEVQAETPNPADNLVAVKIFKGILHATRKVRQARTYTVKNRSEHERTVLIEHPYHADWHLLKPDKPAERSRDVYRFEVKAEPNKPVKLDVAQEQQRVDQIGLTNLDDNGVRVYLRATALSPAVKTALETALKLRAQMAETHRSIGGEQQRLQLIEQDQNRMRQNMARLPQTSEAYKRYLKKFDEQESEIEQLQARITKLRETVEAQQRDFEAFLLNLNVE
jgi:hypothetical protein